MLSLLGAVSVSLEEWRLHCLRSGLRPGLFSHGSLLFYAGRPSSPDLGWGKKEESPQESPDDEVDHSLTSAFCQRGWSSPLRAHLVDLVAEEEGRRVCSLYPRQCLDLSSGGWRGEVDLGVDLVPAGSIPVLVEASLPVVPSKSRQSLPPMRLEWFGRTLCWTADTKRLGVLMALPERQLLRLGSAFLSGATRLHGGWSLLRILTVEAHGKMDENGTVDAAMSTEVEVVPITKVSSSNGELTPVVEEGSESPLGTGTCPSTPATLPCPSPLSQHSLASATLQVSPTTWKPCPPARPPNILVLAQEASRWEQVRTCLQKILAKDRYVVYRLKEDDLAMTSQPPLWTEASQLVVVAGKASSKASRPLQHLLLHGGRLLTLGSDLPELMLPPLKGLTSKEEDVLCKARFRLKHRILSGVANLPAEMSLEDARDCVHAMKVTCASWEDRWKSPSLIVLRGGFEEGVGVFCQAALDVAAGEELMREVLRDQVGLEVEKDGPGGTSKMSDAPVLYLLGAHEAKQALLAQMQPLLDGQGVLKASGVKCPALKFMRQRPKGKNSDLDKVGMVLTQDCPALTSFSTVRYFERLATRQMGRLVLFAEELGSTMGIPDLPSGGMADGMAVVTRRQTAGQGRGANTWLGPVGCAISSMRIVLAADSFLGRHPSLVQNLAALACIQGVNALPGLHNAPLAIKWPNDIFLGREKVGGNIVASTMGSGEVVCVLGMGLNVANSHPTTCLQDHLKENGQPTGPITVEDVLAAMFNRLEEVVDRVQDGHLDYIRQMYYQCWMHTDAEVKVVIQEGKEEAAVVLGIDDYGFLRVRSLVDEREFSVQPDGNSFDLLRGLVGPKSPSRYSTS